MSTDETTIELLQTIGFLLEQLPDPELRAVAEIMNVLFEERGMEYRLEKTRVIVPSARKPKGRTFWMRAVSGINEEALKEGRGTFALEGEFLNKTEVPKLVEGALVVIGVSDGERHYCLAEKKEGARLDGWKRLWKPIDGLAYITSSDEPPVAEPALEMYKAAPIYNILVEILRRKARGLIT